MRLTILLAVIFLIVATADADQKEDEPTIPAFALYYVMVSSTLKHDEGCFDQLLKNPQRTSIADFWWGYILKECDSYMSSRIERLAKSMHSKTDENLDKEVNEMKKQCAMAVILDNWDRINNTIVKDPTKDCISKEKIPSLR